MTDRRRRGARRSSNCFQTSSAFGFLFFMVRSRKEVDSRQSTVDGRQLTVHRQKKGKDLTQRTQRPEHGGHREEKSRSLSALGMTDSRACAGGAPLQGLGTIGTRDVAVNFSTGAKSGPGEMRRKKKRAKPR